MYQVVNFIKLSEEDSYDQGCNFATCTHSEYLISFKSETKEGLLEEIGYFFDVGRDATELDVCDEDGRIDLCIMENANGDVASEQELTDWRVGVGKLYSCTYTGYLETLSAAKWGEEERS